MGLQPEQIGPALQRRRLEGHRVHGAQAYRQGIGMAAAEQAKAARFLFERIGQTKPLLAEFATNTLQPEAVGDV